MMRVRPCVVNRPNEAARVVKCDDAHVAERQRIGRSRSHGTQTDDRDVEIWHFVTCAVEKPVFVSGRGPELLLVSCAGRVALMDSFLGRTTKTGPSRSPGVTLERSRSSAERRHAGLPYNGGGNRELNVATCTHPEEIKYARS